MTRKFAMLFVIIGSLAFGVQQGYAQVCCVESTGCGLVNQCSYFGECFAGLADCIEMDCSTCTDGGNWNNFKCWTTGTDPCAIFSNLMCSGYCSPD